MTTKLFDRIATMLKADAHGVVESLEERSLLLKQCVREAEIELNRKRARLEVVRDEAKRLREALARTEEETRSLDEDVTLALAGGKEELARFAARRLLARQRCGRRSASAARRARRRRGGAGRTCRSAADTVREPAHARPCRAGTAHRSATSPVRGPVSRQSPTRRSSWSCCGAVRPGPRKEVADGLEHVWSQRSLCSARRVRCGAVAADSGAAARHAVGADVLPGGAGGRLRPRVRAIAAPRVGCGRCCGAAGRVRRGHHAYASGAGAEPRCPLGDGAWRLPLSAPLGTCSRARGRARRRWACCWRVSWRARPSCQSCSLYGVSCWCRVSSSSFPVPARATRLPRSAIRSTLLTNVLGPCSMG